ncbi:MAG: site-specific DNA-methyltransferase, partial [Acidobacteria bacterium]|nr:site-specific DNA-methyltransferase [Acidobacteriota bacterium]
IFGDNLLALKALEQEFSGRVKCVFIDPPYNTGSAFTHYDDGLEHSIWLGLMRDRLEIIRRLLASDGSLWITIDDTEAHYLKVLCDEVFGRSAFIASNVWQKRYSRENREAIGDAHDYVMLYAKNADRFKQVRNLVPITNEQAKVYKNPNNHPRGRWRAIPMTAQGYRPNQMYEIVTPGGAVHVPPEGRCWSTIESEFRKLLTDGKIYFGKDGNSQPNIIRFLDEVDGMVPWTWWPHDEVGHTDEAKKEMHELFGKSNAFDTPKPERLIHRILHIATNPNDLVLDSFAGSGTTGAVAHKMGRRWIMVELGEHCHTHIIPRLKKVIDGEDKGGISENVGWQGGGGFRYYRLGPSLIVEDEWGNPVINPRFNAAMLAEAVCKLEGFTFDPNAEIYWRHGQSSETDFIYVTTQMMTREMLTRISDDVGHDRSLLICCGAFNCDVSQFENLTVKKIPRAVLEKCEWGRDDYSLEVVNLPASQEKTPPPEPDFSPDDMSRGIVRRFGKSRGNVPTLFDMDTPGAKGGE